jgi:uncharacterized protein YndB with AHSA1/START domain
MARKQFTLDRTYQGTLDDVWDLWTTAEGIESWWGPEGFAVKVREIDLRPGGVMRYAMSAVAAPQIDFMKRAGMPLTTETSITFKAVEPKTRLAYDNWVDFVPGVAPYSAGTLIELEPVADSVRMKLTIEAMHNEEWTQRAVMGWESEIGKLAKVLESRKLAV